MLHRRMKRDEAQRLLTTERALLRFCAVRRRATLMLAQGGHDRLPLRRMRAGALRQKVTFKLISFNVWSSRRAAVLALSPRDQRSARAARRGGPLAY